MDVVDLGVADRCRHQAGGFRQFRPAEQRPHRLAFGGAAAGDRGDERVGDVPALRRALVRGQRVGRRAHDERGKFADDVHAVVR